MWKPKAFSIKNQPKNFYYVVFDIRNESHENWRFCRKNMLNLTYFDPT
jgi:hypothetical protein